jgi:hypothetical protein
LLNSELPDEDMDLKDAKMDLEIDGKDAKKFLTKYQADNSKPTSKMDSLIAEHKDRIEKWMPTTKSIAENVKEINVPFNLKLKDEKGVLKDTEFTFDYKINDEEKAAINDFISREIQHPDFVYNEENIALVKEMAKSYVVGENFSKFVNGIVSKTEKEINDYWIKRVSNPSALTPQETPAPSGEKKDFEKELLDRI